MTEFLDLDALEAVARAATQERWYRVKSLPANHVVKAEVFPSEYVGESRPSLRVEVGGPNWTRDTDHIAAFDPPTVLALIGRVREAEAENHRLRVMWDKSGKNDLIARAEKAETALAELRAHPLRHLAYDNASVVIDTLIDYVDSDSTRALGGEKC